MSEPRPRVAVIVFPGSNDDRDAALALEGLGAEPVLVWHADRELPQVGAVVLPGGFSYGDYLRAGAIARFSPAMQAVADFAARRRARARHLQRLPGPLRSGAPAGRPAPERVALVRLPRRPAPRRALGHAVPHPLRGRAATDDPGQARRRAASSPTPTSLAELDEARQIVLRYDADNPNGSIDDIAGVVNADGNVMGLMPHPEHAVDPLLGSTDGALILRGLVDRARERLLAPA